MSKLLTIVLVLCLASNSFAAGCDFDRDVRENQDGSFTYSRGCHAEVGKTMRLNGLLGAKIDLLEKQIELKDLQISKYDERTQLWMDTSYKLNDKLVSYQSMTSNDRWIAFGLGVAVTVLSVWAAGQIDK